MNLFLSNILVTHWIIVGLFVRCIDSIGSRFYVFLRLSMETMIVVGGGTICCINTLELECRGKRA